MMDDIESIATHFQEWKKDYYYHKKSMNVPSAGSGQQRNNTLIAELRKPL